MMSSQAIVHPTAIVHPDAVLGEGVEVGPWAIIEGTVRIGARTRVGPRVTIEGNTTIGEDNEIFTGAVVGSRTQDKKFAGGKTYLRIGDRNRIREYVTINPGTLDGTETVIGNDNLLMAYAHVAHDCVIHSGCTLANNGTLAGHVIVEDKAIIGGLSAVHQFVRIGSLSITGGCSKVVQDIPPFMMVDGHPAKAFGLNSVGLDRAGFSAKDKSDLKKAFKIIFKSGLILKNAVKEIRARVPGSAVIDTLVAFLEKSERGICG
ncbi:MAG TPA: acyl-ACP--UDP-N-acetylglucosamine O-acyltransferase [Candidatus Omnitrophota bacterium]|mgnify:CR=1 FL=1|jgi:UDP-N-acetylglucosamine acyltransferase|nr:acyl-ACP--UDP-N-acetylglucosamine O-acyltransferase [Candidatus Omnitrophota bacterium]